MGKHVKFDHQGAEVKLPLKIIIKNWLDTAAPKPARTIPKLGEYWHGQGGIYVGSYLDDDDNERFVVVPVGEEFVRESASYGTSGKEIDAKSLWNGAENTKAMAAAGSDVATWALSKRSEGHQLHIPSVVEGKLCFVNGRKHFEKVWHLTSTQYSAFNAYEQFFVDGGQDVFSKNLKARVQLVRSFTL